MAQATTKAIRLIQSTFSIGLSQITVPTLQENSKEKESGFFVLCHNAYSVPFRKRVNKNHREVVQHKEILLHTHALRSLLDV